MQNTGMVTTNNLLSPVNSSTPKNKTLSKRGSNQSLGRVGSAYNVLSQNRSSLESNTGWDQIEARLIEKEKLDKKKWNRFRPKTSKMKTLLKSYDFGQHKPMMGRKITKSKNNDLFAI